MVLAPPLQVEAATAELEKFQKANQNIQNEMSQVGPLPCVMCPHTKGLKGRPQISTTNQQSMVYIVLLTSEE